MSKAKKFMEEFNGVTQNFEKEDKESKKDKGFDLENNIFATSAPNFEKIYSRIIDYIERRPMYKRLNFYKKLNDALLKAVIGPSMVNRRLLFAARDFWRELQSGKL